MSAPHYRRRVLRETGVRSLINDWQAWNRDERLAALVVLAALISAAIPAAIELSISTIPGIYP
jgi:hypothetical protein